MPKKTELREGEEAAERFRRMVKKVVTVSKDEIDRRAKEWRESRESDQESADKE
jgi:tetrahydromethanopterin S-methyltransferase subunit A